MSELEAPTVRLVAPNVTGNHQGNMEGSGLVPTGRLALGSSPPERNGTSGLEAPAIRLAVCPVGEKGSANSVEHHIEQCGLGDTTLRPALLVSYVYLAPFLKNRHRYAYRDWVLDSGAFSAHNSGTVINLQDYINCCKKLQEEDKTLTEVFSLDVIGDWKASLKNTEEMWRQGVEAIPCFHFNEPESVLKGMAKDYPKIALGGVAAKKGKEKTNWAAQCFARVWPKKIHGFGYGSEAAIMAVPWHSVDATNWELGPCKFGSWKAFGKLSVRGSKQNLRAEVEWYLALEQRARTRWKREMALLAEQPSNRATEREAGSRTRGSVGPAAGRGAGGGPEVRLAVQQASNAQIQRSGLT